MGLSAPSSTRNTFLGMSLPMSLLLHSLLLFTLTLPLWFSESQAVRREEELAPGDGFAVSTTSCSKPRQVPHMGKSCLDEGGADFAMSKRILAALAYAETKKKQFL